MYDIESMSAVTHAKNSLFMCDATQAVGKFSIGVKKIGN
ncbi:cysteine sulfinate desulfinase/cysteine desulfurase-like protein [Flavobacterium piscis]|uniref:Cysteine sulfinate desulfinase/cysteine desulfurase-like protein n=1 Tax=Flavobacterium piscis TaxID=1114874 RepID=A0ABU1YBU2_9FLAO|nr:cysteine sulfinate desulfinase/cysteine desulfurase-like protein [Flavobacterium piscis]